MVIAKLGKHVASKALANQIAACWNKKWDRYSDDVFDMHKKQVLAAQVALQSLGVHAEAHSVTLQAMQEYINVHKLQNIHGWNFKGWNNIHHMVGPHSFNGRNFNGWPSQLAGKRVQQPRQYMQAVMDDWH